MYFYFFDKWFGFDRVAIFEWSTFQAWDIVTIDNDIALCLWENIAFSELYVHSIKSNLPNECIEKKVLSKKTMKCLHAFTTQWFCTYKKSVSLWLWTDIAQLIKKKKNAKSKKVTKQWAWTWINRIVDWDNLSFQNHEFVWADSLESVQKKHQTLIILPSIWSATQQIDKQWLSLPWTAFLHSQSTVNQKIQIFRGIKNWSIDTLFCTYSQLFQDRKKLSHIILIDAHSWWYKNQQDPRYFVPSVVEMIATTYGASIDKTGSLLDKCEEISKN